MTKTRLLTLATVAGLAGCGGGTLDDARFATGSSAIVAVDDYSSMVVANIEEGSVSRVDLESGAVTESAVGERPNRVARLGDRLLVTLRGERAIAVLDEETLQVQTRIPTGAEPYGVVASEDGERFYVTVASERRVEEYDGESLERLRTWSVSEEPWWLALHPNGDALYVASPYGGSLTWIDLDTDVVVPVSLPEVTGLTGISDGEELTPRITGDIAISPDGSSIAVPALYVEHSSPEGDLSAPNPNTAGYYAPPQGGRFNPTALVTGVWGGSVPSDDGWTATLLVTNLEGGDVDPIFGTTERVGSYPSSVTFAQDGEQLLVTMEASDAIVSVPATAWRDHTLPTPSPGAAAPSTDLAIEFRSDLVAIDTARAPRGIALGDGEAYSWSYFGRSVEKVFVDSLAEGPETQRNTTSRVTDEPLYANVGLDPFAIAGRDLFYSARDDRIAATSSGISCSTCHFEGRTDGLTWPLEQGGRQTPSLAGGAAETAPVTWTVDVESPSHEVLITSGGRMGGAGLSMSEADSVAAFIESIPRVDVGTPADAAAVARGAEAFVTAGCDECHSGARYTNNENYAMLGLSSVNTPPLTGIAATAPYFHDGSARTLREVLEFSRSGEMGDTSMLSEAEMADLEAYLKSL